MTETQPRKTKPLAARIVRALLVGAAAYAALYSALFAVYKSGVLKDQPGAAAFFGRYFASCELDKVEYAGGWNGRAAYIGAGEPGAAHAFWGMIGGKEGAVLVADYSIRGTGANTERRLSGDIVAVGGYAAGADIESAEITADGAALKVAKGEYGYTHEDTLVILESLAKAKTATIAITTAGKKFASNLSEDDLCRARKILQMWRDKTPIPE